MNVNLKVKATLESKSDAYVQKNEELFRKFSATVSDIREKEKNFLALERSRRES
jgi:hypothetical protein